MFERQSGRRAKLPLLNEYTCDARAYLDEVRNHSKLSVLNEQNTFERRARRLVIRSVPRFPIEVPFVGALIFLSAFLCDVSLLLLLRQCINSRCDFPQKAYNKYNAHECGSIFIITSKQL